MTNVVPLRSDQPLGDEQMAAINKGHCPDCNHRGFVLGPRGGAAQNLECGGCANRFNVAVLPASHHVVLGHRIPRGDQGGGDWG